MEGMELINAMSKEDLEGVKEKHADNESIVKLIDGIMEARVREEAEVRAKLDFEKGITRMFAKLPHPEGVHNIYTRWGEVEIPNGEPEEVETVLTPAITDKEGNTTTPAVMTKETRTPTRKEFQWIVQVNHSVRVTSGNGTPTTSKRAITVMRRNGLNLEPIGNFPSASKACEHLRIPLGGDSGNRVLARENYITEPYEGTDFLN